MLITLLIGTAAWALGPSKIGPLLDFSGQGMPRETLEDCQTAGTKLAELLSKKGFKSITTDCMGTSAEIGGLVPTLLAKNADRFRTEQLMNGPLSDAASCDKALKLLLATVGANGSEEAVEAECLQGTHVDWQGKKTAYFQPWVTKLIKLSDANAKAAKSVEHDLRGNKAVVAPSGAPARAARPADLKPQAK